MPPADLRYTKSHEWVRFETDAAGKKIAVVGITDFALQALTDLVFIELPQSGRAVKAGEPFGEVESVKAVSDLYSPVNGEVLEANTELTGNLEPLGKDPYGAGWLVKIAMSDESGVASLMDEAAYRKQCEQELNE